MNEHRKTLELVKMFHETATIESQMPIEIGSFKMVELLVKCGRCFQPIPQEMIHGYATQPIPLTASFHAVAVCKTCEHITESVNRFKKIGKHRIRHEKLSEKGKWLVTEADVRGGSTIELLFAVLAGSIKKIWQKIKAQNYK